MRRINYRELAERVNSSIPGLRSKYGIDPKVFAYDVLDINDLFVVNHGDDPVPGPDLGVLDQAIQKFIGGEPLQYITGRAYFDGLSFKVDKRVLIPRHDSEYLVEAVAREITRIFKERPSVTRPLRLIEIGTGSGALTIALMHRFSDQIRFLATDISRDAVEAASENFDLHFPKLAGRAQEIFICADLCGGVESSSHDILFSNPPYVDIHDEIDEHVKREPALALFADQQGTAFYERLFSEAAYVIKEGGSLIVEIGAEQSLAVRNSGIKHGLAHERSVNDISGIERVLHFRKGKR